jgi:DNA-binding NarL/FixJ family response regulator
MAGLDETLARLTRAFADDVVAALRTASVKELVLATKSRSAVQPMASSGNTVDEVIAEMVSASNLTERETTILKLAVDGKGRVAIAQTLGVSENTIKSQARVLLQKVHADSLSDAAIAVLHRALRTRSTSSKPRPGSHVRR